MLRLANNGLPPKAAATLADYQAEIDCAGDYATRVAEGKRKFGSRNTRRNSTFRAVRSSLSKMCAGAQRCVYCEDSVGDEVEHIKPKDLYPEDVFRWLNYVFACGPCNGGKNNKFAVITAEGRVDVTRARGAPITPPTQGKPAFVNPRTEDPLDFFTIDLLGTFFVLPREELTGIAADKAEFTIETLNLNRDLLLEARQNAFGGYRARLREYRNRRDAVADASELKALRDDLMATPHPTIWEEMKRQAPDIPQLAALFATVPEALGWTKP
ncbi:hypothetical protein [Ruegeria sp. HKCCD8929]|uniref:hypothetical protein n=1 Tax=Ruegeria sp. HKCCD8929 TaxID=2683006 RepID=UPI001489C5E5|nr:hypothetical protein [Ruegeria sp. HKCCD8929]